MASTADSALVIFEGKGGGEVFEAGVAVRSIVSNKVADPVCIDPKGRQCF